MVGGIENRGESMPKTRKSHPPSLKAKVAVEAIKAHKTAAQIAQNWSQLQNANGTHRLETPCASYCTSSWAGRSSDQTVLSHGGWVKGIDCPEIGQAFNTR